ncbi:cysteine hydrolase family protein [Aquitalea aquatica]|uniref:Cysteine hydrolase n=1 Tax=Aquitalea aquatica TaxID=3044273 RepID=A0A838Y7R9_9NEIS|nr:cysteine hydrolase family protein [Aquitalea magnusonii]MBA4709918.1 cysteine hydrolase [Aquitalea magnusonii]
MRRDSALLIVDVQVAQFEPAPPYQADAVLARLNQAIALARQQGMPVIFVQHDSPPGTDLAPGSAGWALHPALQRLPEDLVVHKTVGDSFYRPELHALLQQLGIHQLWIGGSATDFCIDYAIRSALSHDYAVTVLEDAHTCRNRPLLSGEQVVAHFNWVWRNMDETPQALRVCKVAELG